MSIFKELKRRNVFRVVIAYLAGAWLLIQVADTVFPVYGLPDSALQILITVLTIGLLPVTVLSWAFEWTPDGLKRDAGGDSIAPQTHTRLDRVIMIVLALGVGFFAFDKFVLDPGRDAEMQRAAEERGRTDALIESYGDRSIAVLPFADMSAEGDQAFFSDGISEEILNLLARLEGVRVISRSSAFQYRGDVHIPTVAEELNVSYVLEGSVRKSGNDLRITAQLIDARSDAHVWSDTYPRELDDIFEIQDEIAAAIVNALQVKLLGSELRSRRTDPETYALYLRARHLLITEQSTETSIVQSLLEQALERDPDYLPAVNLMVNAIYWHSGSNDESIRRMDYYVDRALEIDPRNSSATAHRGWMTFFYRQDLEAAAGYVNRALEYDPNDDWTLYVATMMSLRTGKNDEAIAFAEAALARDPLCSGCLYNLMFAQARSGRYDEAIASSERRMQAAGGGWHTLGDIYLLKGDAARALEMYNRQKDNPPLGWLRSQAIAFHDLRQFEQRDAALADLVDLAESALDTSYKDFAFESLAAAQAWVGNIDDAFKVLDRYLDPADPDFIWAVTRVVWDPIYQNLRDDPRWTELREQAGLGEERLSGIHFELPAR